MHGWFSPTWCFSFYVTPTIHPCIQAQSSCSKCRTLRLLACATCRHLACAILPWTLPITTAWYLTWHMPLDDSAAMTCSTSLHFFPSSLCSPALRPSAAHSSCLRSLNVSSRDPRLIIALCASRDSRSVSANHRRLISRVDRLGATGGLLRALATLASALLLREQRCDPGIVDEVAGASECGREENVQEDAVIRALAKRMSNANGYDITFAGRRSSLGLRQRKPSRCRPS